MKILYLHRVASKDGQYVHIDEIINSMRKDGHEVTIVAPQMAEEQDFGGDGGFVATLKQKLPKAFYEILEFCYSFLVLYKILKAAKRVKPDFIYERYNIYNPSGVWAKRLLGLPHILEINAPLYAERKKFDGLALPWFARWSEQYTWKNADHVLPVTQVLADIVAEAGVSRSKMSVIHNGINCDDFLQKNSDTVDQKSLGAEGKVVIGFVGFCRDWHGLDKIVELLNLPGNEHLFLLVVGDGPAREGIAARATDLAVENRVHITGVVSRDEVPRWLDVIDIALQPEAVGYASPLKMIEYLGKGKAIVAPRQPNICELLEDEVNAVLFSEASGRSLLDSVQVLANDESLRAKVSQGASDTIERLSLTWDGNVQRILNIYRALSDRQGAE